jgi:hypothetical protein
VSLKEAGNLFNPPSPYASHDCADQFQRTDAEELLWLAPGWANPTLPRAALAPSTATREEHAYRHSRSNFGRNLLHRV